MKAIELTKGQTAIIDDQDYRRISAYKWYIGSDGYARRTSYAKGKSKNIFMHRQILFPHKREFDGIETDHINGNRLDNRRSNLRAATREQNQWNRKKPETGGSSKYKGVSLHSRDNSWYAYITTNGKHKHLGSFDNEEQAARAYNIAAEELHGEFARLNNTVLTKKERVDKFTKRIKVLGGEYGFEWGKDFTVLVV